MPRLKVLLVIYLSFLPVFGQRTTFVGKLGTGLSSAYGDEDSSRWYAAGFGGVIKLQGPAHIEVDAINRSQSLVFSHTAPDPDSGLQVGDRHDRIWDIPILYRHQYGKGRVWLFGSAGMVLRSYATTTNYVNRMGQGPGTPIEHKEHHWKSGYALGPGFGFSVGHGVGIEPEFKYTSVGSLPRDRVAEFIIGIRFGISDR